MSLVPDQLLYRESHEWVDTATGLVGITDHAQHELTDVVYVELPKVGAVVKAGDHIAVVESVKAASDIYSPVSGEIVEANEALSGDPSLLNTDPYDKGWICKIKVADPAESGALMDAASYRQHIA